jgi:hypothetical protein
VKPRKRHAPLLFLDVDGVISLFGFDEPPPGRFHWVDGVAHFIPAGCGARVRRLGKRFELVWATGWEETANEYLPRLLELPVAELPYLTFGEAVFGTAHWKVAAIDAYAGDQPAAWIDDSLDERCHEWARGREAPTLLLETDSATGLLDSHVEQLLEWAERN